jgi:hypothetical protein
MQDRKAYLARSIYPATEKASANRSHIKSSFHLHMPRQQMLHERDRPLLQRLGQHSMVRVENGVGRDRPSRVPVHVLLVHQNAHELGDRERWVGLSRNSILS